jgi:hypothetical protein
MTLNAAGYIYALGQFGSTAKFCVREAVYDVGDVEPSAAYRCGTAYIEMGDTNFPNIRTPRLVVTYDKDPDWGVYMDATSVWNINGQGTWDGSKYITTNDALQLVTVGSWAADYKPYKIRMTFTGASSIYVEMYNTDGTNNLFDDREQFTSGEEKVINNYNNLDIWRLWIFNWDSGNFDVTNIEFLEP